MSLEVSEWYFGGEKRGLGVSPREMSPAGWVAFGFSKKVFCVDDLPILNCDDCGACCMSIGHPHFWRAATGENADPHWAGLPDNLKTEINQYIDGLEDHDMGQPCIWLDLDTKSCRHYEHRPQMCRDFEVNSFHCRRIRSEFGIEF